VIARLQNNSRGREAASGQYDLFSAAFPASPHLSAAAAARLTVRVREILLFALGKHVPITQNARWYK